MQHQNQESAISGPINLLKHYSFESNGQSYENVLNSWLGRFPLNWVNLALIESLHQGRYKVVSVEQILTLWQRRGKPSYHFNHDFERLVSNNLPQSFQEADRQHTMKSQTHRQRLHRSNRPFSIRPDHPNPEDRAPLEPSLWDISSRGEYNPKNSIQTDSDREMSTPPEPVISDLDNLWPEVSLKTQPSQTNTETIPLPQEITESGLITATIESETQPNQDDSTHTGETDELGEVSQQAVSESPDLQISVPFSATTGDKLHPIDQFVPQSASSVFYSKLTAMAQINV